MGEIGCLKDGNFQNLQVGGRTILGSSAGGIVTKSATSGTIPVTVNAVNAVPPIKQPAGTFIKDIFFTSAGDIVTAGGNGDDFDFKIGTAAAGPQLVAFTALLDDGGAAVTLKGNVPLPIIKDGMGQAANAFTTTGIGPKGGPATTEAIVLALATYSGAARDIHVTFTPITNALATAATTIKVVISFMYI